MSQIDLLVHPADNESFGRVVVEAMAAGLSGRRLTAGEFAKSSAVRQQGCLADTDDPAELAGCIQRLAGDPSAGLRWGAAGRRRAESIIPSRPVLPASLRVYEMAMARPVEPIRPLLTHQWSALHMES